MRLKTTIGTAGLLVTCGLALHTLGVASVPPALEFAPLLPKCAGFVSSIQYCNFNPTYCLNCTASSSVVVGDGIW